MLLRTNQTSLRGIFAWAIGIQVLSFISIGKVIVSLGCGIGIGAYGNLLVATRRELA